MQNMHLIMTYLVIHLITAFHIEVSYESTIYTNSVKLLFLTFLFEITHEPKPTNATPK